MLRPDQLTEKMDLMDGEQVRIYDEAERFYGIYRYHKEADVMKPVRMFPSSED